MNIFVTGANGFLGKSICEEFSEKHNILKPDHKELELLDEEAVKKYISKNDIDIIIHCANRGGNLDTVGLPNTIEYNLRIFFNLVKNSDGIKKMINFGSGAEYSKHRQLHKVKEEEFGSVIPKDDYGFYKYTINKIIENSDNMINLRLFGIFGKYENYEYKFVSNAIVKNLFGLDMHIKQNLIIDYLYITDFLKIIEHFLKNKNKFKTYNVTPTKSIELVKICEIINEMSDNKNNVKFLNSGLNYEYTGENSRLMKEMGSFNFLSYEDAIKGLFNYYKDNLHLVDKTKLVDKYLYKYAVKKS
ncbi:MAG: NAD-dependent epimerase/dehydratase family protein [Candidatus Micrarchaeota archaeon]|nr:NAD-dependent epimerase/dehydratase family protein [Candidatus Micrarchaeota archaeon]